MNTINEDWMEDRSELYGLGQQFSSSRSGRYTFRQHVYKSAIVFNRPADVDLLNASPHINKGLSSLWSSKADLSFLRMRPN